MRVEPGDDGEVRERAREGLRVDAGREDVIDFGDAFEPSPGLTLTIPERIAIQTHKLRIWVSVITLATFLVLNGLVLAGLYQALLFDFHMMAAKTPGYVRFINTQVILSILGATAVQLGAMMIAIAKFLFSAKN